MKMMAQLMSNEKGEISFVGPGQLGSLSLPFRDDRHGGRGKRAGAGGRRRRGGRNGRGTGVADHADLGNGMVGVIGVEADGFAERARGNERPQRHGQLDGFAGREARGRDRGGRAAAGRDLEDRKRRVASVGDGDGANGLDPGGNLAKVQRLRRERDDRPREKPNRQKREDKNNDEESNSTMPIVNQSHYQFHPEILHCLFMYVISTTIKCT